MYKLALTFPSPCYYSFVRVSFSFVMNEQRTQSYHRRLNAIHRAFPDNKSCFSERAEFVHAFLPTIDVRRPSFLNLCPPFRRRSNENLHGMERRGGATIFPTFWWERRRRNGRKRGTRDNEFVNESVDDLTACEEKEK